MKQYLLSVPMIDGAPPRSPGDAQQAYEQVSRLNDELQAAGAWVFGGGLHPPSTATVVRVQDGQLLTTDGPFAECKEHIGGFCVITASDLDAALEWGSKLARATTLPIEIRPFQRDGSADA